MAADHAVPFFTVQKIGIPIGLRIIIQESRPLTVRSLVVDDPLQRTRGFLESHQEYEQDLWTH